MDPDTKRLLMFAGGLGGVLTCLVAGSSLIGHHNGVVPVIAADTRPIKVRPENPGGMQIDAAENDVFSGGSDPSTAKLAPPAETPNPNGLHDRPKPAVQATSPTAAPPLPEAKPAAVATQEATPPKAAVVAAAKAPTPAPAAAKPAPNQPAASTHPASVQLAALTSEQAAHEEWQQMTKRMPELLNGHQPVFTHIERDGHSFWRVRTAGFTDVTQARTFCEHVKAKGGSCSVADF
jgi:hypothetical protein